MNAFTCSYILSADAFNKCLSPKRAAHRKKRMLFLEWRGRETKWPPKLMVAREPAQLHFAT